MLVIGRREGQSVVCRNASGELIIVTHAGRTAAGINVHITGVWQRSPLTIHLLLGAEHILEFLGSKETVTITFNGKHQSTAQDVIGFEADRSIRIGRLETAQGQEAVA